MKQKYLLFGLLVLFLVVLTLSFTLAHEQTTVSTSSSTRLDYEHFRSDLVSRGYELGEGDLTNEFHFLQQLQRKYPSWSYQKLFATYYSLHIWYLEDYRDENLF